MAYVGSPVYNGSGLVLRKLVANCVNEMLAGDQMDSNGVWWRVYCPRKRYIWQQRVEETYSDVDAWNPWSNVVESYDEMESSGAAFTRVQLPSSVDGSEIHGWILKGSGICRGSVPGTWVHYHLLEAWTDYIYNTDGLRKKRIT